MIRKFFDYKRNIWITLIAVSFPFILLFLNIFLPDQFPILANIMKVLSYFKPPIKSSLMGILLIAFTWCSPSILLLLAMKVDKVQKGLLILSFILIVTPVFAVTAVYAILASIGVAP